MQLVQIPARAEQSGTLIWLHGLGASGHDFESVVPHLRRPDLRVVLPHAPVMPVTINGGMRMRAWYNITTMDHVPGRNDPADIASSREAIEELIHAEHDRGVPYDRIGLVGFSQGGAMALHTGLGFSETLAGVVVLSAYELDGTESHPANAATPMFFGHGSGDPVVPMSSGRAAFESVGGDRASWQDYPMAHEVCLEEIEALGAFLERVISEMS
ncbi:MAG: carboxylesterase [Proteobacteria bacterium]|nr:carboxylesterase [Pseudomonadota bacterium]MCP4921695.1 carboxylesterase [Pseudomonadota bacterium]